MAPQAPNSQVHVIDHPLVQHKLTLMRKRETSSSAFRRLSSEISGLLAYEVTRHHPVTLTRIRTPLQAMTAPLLDGKKLVVISILRAGIAIADGIVDAIPIGADRSHRPVPGPEDRDDGGVLLQGAREHV